MDLGLSRAEAPGLWEELRGLAPEERSALVLGKGRYTTWGMAELLCAESLAATEPGRAVELAGLAAWISLSLREWQPAEEAWMIELRAYALAHLGHAWSWRGDRIQAECAFTLADIWWSSVAGDMGDVLGYEKRILELRGQVRRGE